MSTADLSGAVSGADSPPQEPVTSPDHTEPGSRRRPDRIGAYVLLYRLGHGGMSEVHLAEHMETGERVAIKHVPAGGDPNHLRRLRREARTTARLEHPGIVRVREAIDGDEGLWLVMDHVAGTTLYNVTHDGPMEPVRALRIALQIAEALIAAHDLGILHRDLKSENVMLTPPGDRVRLLDFGLAKMLWTDEESQSLTVHGEVMGTCRAMSPEQA
ncbi:MAG: serine/threonine-protein kinase, partial [Acidobacteriota bacterium]